MCINVYKMVLAGIVMKCMTYTCDMTLYELGSACVLVKNMSKQFKYLATEVLTVIAYDNITS